MDAPTVTTQVRLLRLICREKERAHTIATSG
jgi:hypothetical protein